MLMTMSTPGPRVMWLIQHDPPPTPLCFRDRAQWQDYLTQLAASGERITRKQDLGKHSGRRTVRVVFSRIDYCQDCEIGGRHQRAMVEQGRCILASAPQLEHHCAATGPMGL